MAEIKWIKIVTDIFDNRKIKQIESLPDGDTIIVIWFKLLCLAGVINDNGSIYITQEIPYTEETLATQFNRPLATIQLAMKTFQAFGMIEVINDVLHISNWENYQNIEGMEKVREQNRIRQQRHRASIKLMNEPKKCVYCGSTEKISVDHIIALTRGGEDNDSNKVWCCLSCNQQKNNFDLSKFLNDKLLMNEYVDIEGILSNTKLKKVLGYSNGKFYMLSQMSRDSHATDKNKNKNNIYIVEIVNYLNSVSGKNFSSSTQNTIKHINARLEEGFTVDDFKTVIDTKCEEWSGTDMAKYIRPDTLFGTKFESYLNQEDTNKPHMVFEDGVFRIK